MSFLDNILLSIKREYGGNEKYKLFLQQLNRLEDELAKERKYANDLLKENKQLKQEVNNLSNAIGGYEGGKGYVKDKTHEKMCRMKKEWEDRYWELNRKYQSLLRSEQNVQASVATEVESSNSVDKQKLEADD